jgi:Na+/H+ antiporter NhaD/arsenite permease-like protein
LEADYYSIIPFVLLLLSIAFIPLLNKHWWDKNYYIVTIVLALVIVVYYLINGSFSYIAVSIEDYVKFISLLASLYVVSGGIFISIKGASTPLKNVALLSAGTVLANIIGTTGASMLLIRPYINVNKLRITNFHIVFFIFIISNAGGALTPIGDPPLFLGYLKGIPFFWIIGKIFFQWLLVMILILAVFYLFDIINFKKQPLTLQEEEEKTHEKIEIKGLSNLIFFAVIIVSVFITEPLFLREAIMLFSAFLSYKITNKEIHTRNHFDFLPIKEVAWLFLGIFVTMTPALELLSHHSKELNITSPTSFYWMTGLLSSLLDNAPTYLTFLTAAMGLFDLNIHNVPDVLNFIAEHHYHVIAISLSAVFFGAMTYIGNGPNFMVKSIADSRHVKAPGFLGYIFKYSLPILLPIYFIVWLLFIL